MMAQFTLQGAFGSKNPVQFRHYCKRDDIISKKLGFGDFCMTNHGNVNGCRRKTRIWVSSRSYYKSSKLVNGSDSFQEFDELDDDDEDDYDADLSCFRGLVLDVSYRPINVVCWKRAICLEFMEKADVLEYYDQTVNSPSGSFNIPAVLRVPHLLQVMKRKRVKTSLSRRNILNRDDNMCQYCRATQNLTIDHVIPISRGGEWEWENLVAACSKCNSKKGHKTLEESGMTLIKVPKEPKDYDILAIPLTSSTTRMLRKGMPQEWRQYLPS